MNLSQYSNEDILQRLEKLVRTERKITHLVLSHINEVRRRRLFAELGYSSLHEYLVKHLGYADDSAYRRDQAARVLLQAPQVAEKLENGSLNLTQLTQVQRCLRQELKTGELISPAKTAGVLQLLENKNNYESQRILAVEFNQPIQFHEIVKPQRDSTVRMEISFSDEQMNILRKAKDYLSHILPEANWAEFFVHLAEKQVRKNEGKKSLGNKFSKSPAAAASADCMPEGDTSAPTQDFSAKPKRGPIKITTKRKLLNVAGGCCEYVNQQTGRRCESAYQLQVDHQVPLAFGGVDNESNYRILCRTHNLLSAQRWGLI